MHEIDLEVIVRHHEAAVSDIADEGVRAQVHAFVGAVVIFHLQARFQAQAAGQVEAVASQPAGVEPDVEQQGGIILRIETAAGPHLVDRRHLAVETDHVGLMFAQDLVTDGFEGAGTDQAGYAVVQLRLGDAASETQHLAQVGFVAFRDAFELHAGDPDGFIQQVDGLAIRLGTPGTAQAPLDLLQVLPLPVNGLLAALDDGIYALFIEAEHAEVGEFRMDIHRRGLHAGLIGLPPENVHGLIDDIHQVVDFISPVGRGRNIHANDDVRPEFLGDFRREVAAQAAVHQDHALGTDRGEQPRDGHGGPHRVAKPAAVPDLRLGGDHVAGHADKGDGQGQEIPFVLEAYYQAAQEVTDVLPLYQTVRNQAAAALVRLGLLPVEIQSGGAERQGKLKAVLVVFPGRGIEFPRMGIPHQHVPVHAPDDDFQLVGGIAAGIQAAHQTTDTRAQHHIHRDALFFQAFDDAQVGRTLGAAAGQDQGDRRTSQLLAQHFPPESLECLLIPVRVDAIGIRLGGRAERQDQQK